MTAKRTVSDVEVAIIRAARSASDACRMTGVSISYCKSLRRGDRRPNGEPPAGRFSLIQHVTDLVNEMGECTVDDLMPHCHGRTRSQVFSAVHMARYQGRISLVQLGAIDHNGARPSTYGPLDAHIREDQPLPTRTGPRGDFGIPKVASVWEFAERIAA